MPFRLKPASRIVAIHALLFLGTANTGEAATMLDLPGCTNCMPSQRGCEAVLHHGPAIIAKVSGEKIIDTLATLCTKPTEGIGCAATTHDALYSFSKFEPIVNKLKVDGSAHFEAIYEQEDEHPENRSGLYLRPDRSYFIMSTGSTGESNNFSLSAACEIN